MGQLRSQFRRSCRARRLTAISPTISQVIANDLKRSGLFVSLNPSTFVGRITDFDTVPQFANWRKIDASALVTGRVAHHDDGRLEVKFRLWDVASGQQLAGQQYVTSPDYWR